MRQYLGCLCFFVCVLGTLSCYGQDQFDNSGIEWKLTPLGNFLPVLEERELLEFKKIANDESKVLNLLMDKSKFAFTHVALCQLKMAIGSSSSMQSLGEINTNYFGLSVRAEFVETRYSARILVEYPDVERQVSKLSSRWENNFWANNDSAMSIEKAPTIQARLQEKYKAVVKGMSEVNVAPIESKLTSDLLAFPSHGIGAQRPFLARAEMNAVKKKLVTDPAKILDWLSDSEQLPVVHVALTNCFFLDDVYSVFRHDGQDVDCNGLTIEIRVKFKDGNRNQTIRYPNVDSEKHHIKKFWSLVFEHLGK